jgi:hypothetical protein
MTEQVTLERRNPWKSERSSPVIPEWMAGSFCIRAGLVRVPAARLRRNALEQPRWRNFKRTDFERTLPVLSQ